MSNRMLRKLQGQSDLAVVETLSESDDASATHVIAGARKKIGKTRKHFDLLTNLEQSDTEAKEDDDGETCDQPSGQVDSKSEAIADSRKRKKRRKKPHSQKSTEQPPADDVEACVREVEEMLGEPSQKETTPEQPAERGLLAIEHRHLNPANEMKKIFGFKVVQSEHIAGKKKGRGRIHGRPTVLVVPKNWPQVGKPGISMDLLEKKNNILYFTYLHSKQYQRIQYEFLDAVESYNPDNIVVILNEHPYHVDALLQFSDVCKMGDDLQVAADLIERTLYSLECCSHPLFNVARGDCRLDYRRVENRSLFVAIFKHLNFVGQRGCNRTALEFCKLLLSLDPENDPLCALLLIDYYALRSEQYEFLLRVHREWEAERNLSQLPNFAFSVPLAMFLMDRNQGREKSCSADTSLQNALFMFPGLLLPLLDECGVRPDSRVANHSFFSCTEDNPGLAQLISLYVGRCHLLWKQKETIAWLENNVSLVLQMVDEGDPRVAENRAKCRIRYRGTPRNILRHIVLSEIKKATVSLPPDISNSPIFGYDPLPPLDGIGDYTRPVREDTTQPQGMLSTFFRSLMPSFDNLQERAGGEQQQQAATPNGDLRRSVASLIDAMHDLLNNIHMADVPDDGDVESEDDRE